MSDELIIYEISYRSEVVDTQHVFSMSATSANATGIVSNYSYVPTQPPTWTMLFWSTLHRRRKHGKHTNWTLSKITLACCASCWVEMEILGWMQSLCGNIMVSQMNGTLCGLGFPRRVQRVRWWGWWKENLCFLTSHLFDSLFTNNRTACSGKEITRLQSFWLCK